MSSDAFGFPRRRFDFGRDIALAGQPSVIGARYRMPQYLCWSRVDAASGSVQPYITFDLPGPLPVGTFVRVTGVVLLGATDTIGLALSPDWNKVSPLTGGITLATVTAITGTGGGGAPYQLVFGVRGYQSGYGGCYAGAESLGSNISDPKAAFRSMTRWGVYTTQASGCTIHSAFVEAFIPAVVQ